MVSDVLRQIPKTDVVLALPEVAAACDRYTRAQVRGVVQAVLDDARESVLKRGRTDVPNLDEAGAEVLRRLRDQGVWSLRRVVNATGVVLHTNLGRAPLGDEVAAHVAEIARGYSNLEYDLEAGARGSRFTHVERLACELTGAEAAMVVNNNAGAVFLMLNTLCAGSEVAVSRGELVEIGGSFRVPEVMARSGTSLVEVGTTNKTHAFDYREVVGREQMSALLKVHTSNFRVTGFVEEVEPAELVSIAHEAGVYALYDIGSALPLPAEALGLTEGHTARSALRDGVDVACFSGDKLLGGAQAGILVGRRDLIERIKKNQLARILRIDKLSLAALEMTLAYCVDQRTALERIPTLGMLAMTRKECRQRATALARRLAGAAPGLSSEVLDTVDEAGGGSLPGVELPGAAVSVRVRGMEVSDLERALRAWRTPIICRVHEGAVLVSPRTLLADDEDVLLEALVSTARAHAAGGEAIHS
jgi:L-seryl-tRNA(Ser) seleniumtransferase